MSVILYKRWQKHLQSWKDNVVCIYHQSLKIQNLPNNSKIIAKVIVVIVTVTVKCGKK